MKQVVCREDIKVELDMLSDMKFKILMLKEQVQTLQDRVNLLEAKSSVMPSANTSVSVPISTWDTPHMYWWEAIRDVAERTLPDRHWDINDDWTVTFVSD